MTDQERELLAEPLLLYVMNLRPDDGAKGGAWCLAVATKFLSRAILAQIGPKGEPTALLEVTMKALAAEIEAAQLQFHRDQLQTPPSQARGPRRVQ